jgi:putative flippase GtrA
MIKKLSNIKVVRYIISGGTAATVDLVILYLLTSIVGIWYLFSAIIAFLIALGVSFSLQKFWTFADHSTDRMSSQVVVYFIVASINLGLNTLLMYLLVDAVLLPYLLAQIIAAGLIACESFFVYQRYIFIDETPNI